MKKYLSTKNGSIRISFAKDKEQSNWQCHQNINNSVDSNLVEINASQEQSYQQEDDNLKNEIGQYTIDRRKYQLRSTIEINQLKLHKSHLSLLRRGFKFTPTTNGKAIHTKSDIASFTRKS